MKKSALQRFVLYFLFVGWIIVLVKFILFKHQWYVIRNYFNDDFPSYTIADGLAKANFIPFKSILEVINNANDYKHRINNNFGNLAGFFPAGILLPLIFKRINNFTKISTTVFFISFFFETMQLLLGVGIFDIDDLILNTLGGLMGLGFLFVWIKLIHPKNKL